MTMNSSTSDSANKKPNNVTMTMESTDFDTAISLTGMYVYRTRF